MNLIASTIRTIITLLVVAGAAHPGIASPGAHGPNGEHLDGPANAAAGADSAPKMEAKSEQFELVATLGGGELSLLIDRFQTNEPVLDARVEVESGKLKASAKFHADNGDYAVDDAALLKALAQPGAHPILVTLIAGKDSDLLEGTLNVTTAVTNTAGGHSHGHGGDHGTESTGHGQDINWRLSAAAAGGLAALGLGGLWWQRRNRRASRIEVSQ